MIKALFILTALALVQARPNEDAELREADCELLDNGCPVDYTINKNIAHEKYCHLFYTCVRGELVLVSCPEPLYFDANTEVCAWPWETTCVNDGPYTYPPTADVTTPPEHDVGDLLDNGCPSNFSIVHLLPHETCEKYYECNSGVKVERNCGPGTVFNFLTQSCDWPANVPHCADSPGATASPVAPEDSEEIQIPNDPESWESLPNGCPVDPSINHLLPHGSECDKFYSCENGELVLLECPPSTHFSPTLQICTWPHEAGCEWWTGGCPPGDCEECCDGPSAPTTTTLSTPTTAAATTTTTSAPTTTTTRTTSAPTTTTTTTSAPTTTTTTTTSAPTTSVPTTSAPTTSAPTTSAPTTSAPTVIPVTTTTKAPESSEELNLPSDPETPGGWESLPNGCPADFDVHWLLPHEYDCDKFYYCAHGEKVLFPCPGGTHFSPTLQQCTWPQLAGCEHWDGGCSSPGDGGSCDSQTTTSVATGPTTTVSAGTTVVVPTTNTAVPSTTITVPSTTAAVPSTTTAVPSTTTAVPSTITAVPSTTNAVPSTTNAVPSTTTTAPSTSTNVPVTTTSQPTTIRPDCPECPPGPGNPADICKEECNVNPWPHPECDKFYSCVGNELQLNICSEGLHFNPTTFTCDFICNAGCVRNIPQITRHSDGLLMFIPNGFENTENMIDLIEYKLKTEL